MMKRYQLRGISIYINEDCHDGTLKERKNLYQNMKTVKEAGKIVYSKGKKLIIKERK